MAEPTGGERRVALTSALGKEVGKEEASVGVTLFIGEGERDEGVGCTVHRSGTLTISFLFFQLNVICKL
jgi:hypothetical protein